MLDLTKESNTAKVIERVVEGPTGKLVLTIRAGGLEIRPYNSRDDGGRVSLTWSHIYVEALKSELGYSRRSK